MLKDTKTLSNLVEAKVIRLTTQQVALLGRTFGGDLSLTIHGWQAGQMDSLDFFDFNAVSMLFWSAVVNGVLAPPLIVLIVLLTSDPAVMGRTRTNPLWLRTLGWTTAVVMGVAAVAMLVTAVI